METGGVTMTAGVQTNIGVKSHNSEAAQTSRNIQSNEHAESKEVEQIVSAPEVEHDVKEFSDKENAVKEAEKIFETAKKDGVDKAFDELAREDEVKDLFEENYRNDHTLDDKELAKDGEIDEVQVKKVKEEKEEIDPLEIKVRALEARVTQLASENSDLKKRLEKAEEMNQTALLTLKEMSEVLLELLKDGEDEERKKSLIALLTNMIAKMIAAIIVPEEVEGNKKGKANNKKGEIDLSYVIPGNIENN